MITEVNKVEPKARDSIVVTEDGIVTDDNDVPLKQFSGIVV